MRKARISDDGETVTIKCPARHYHSIRIKKNEKWPDLHVWKWNGSETHPTFTPSINECTGKLVPENTEKWQQIDDPEWKKEYGEFLDRHTYRCHFILTDGLMNFCGDCTHGLVGQQKVELLDVDVPFTAE